MPDFFIETVVVAPGTVVVFADQSNFHSLNPFLPDEWALHFYKGNVTSFNEGNDPKIWKYC